MRNVLVQAPSPYNNINIVCDRVCDVSDLEDALWQRLPQQLLDVCTFEYCSSRQSTEPCDNEDIYLRLSLRLPGGKGGFGSQLRAAGGRMKSNKKANTEAMKDVSGHRLRTLKKAQELAEALRDAPEREREEHKQKRDKLLAIINTELPGRGGRQVKFDDEEYIAQSENILEDIKHALELAYEDEESERSTDEELSVLRSRDIVSSSKQLHSVRETVPKKLAGWDDEDDEDLLDDSSDEESVQAQTIANHSGSSVTEDKGKGKNKVEDSQIDTGKPVVKRRRIMK